MKPTRKQTEWLTAIASYCQAAGVSSLILHPCGCCEARMLGKHRELPCNKHGVTASGYPRTCDCLYLDELTQKRAEAHKVAHSDRWPEEVRDQARAEIEELRKQALEHRCEQ